MRLAYTVRVDIGGDPGVWVRRAGSGTEGEAGIDIPSGVSVRAISICPDIDGTTFPVYWVKGVHGDSVWAKVDAGVGEFEMDGLTDNVSPFLKIKADSGTKTFNIYVKGQ